MEFDLENPLTDSNQEICSLFVSESDQMPLLLTNFDISVRRETISCILQCSCNLDPFVTYLAVNYLDRFLSTQGILQVKKAWIVRLIAISCISLAAKMKISDFSTTHFQIDEDFIFDVKTIERMEYIILGALKWRMRSITPLSFISLFISMFQFKDPPLMNQALKDRAIGIILQVQNDISLLGFKPSIIAGSALLFACHELLPSQFSCFNEAISNCSYVNKENLWQCYKVVQQTATNIYDQSIVDTLSSLDTPVNVLDKDFSSDDNATISSSSSTSVRLEGDFKRRKVNGDSEYLISNRTVQISQILGLTD